MRLNPGDHLGPYEILATLGVGGMGEVYRALDPTLKREVALKVLPIAFLSDPERRARFQREAEVLASLDHPNIGPIHGMVDAEDSRALVLALIEGPTLADRLAAGPLPPEEALHVVKQIVAALEYAHERGVIHRDLKPANIKINPDGVVKVLDFGLAKVLEYEPPPSSLADSPTLTMGHTRAGTILGTAAYMSPEQAVGRTVDRRSDIFSFGALFYEMLTGQRAFAGSTTPDVLEAVVKNDPDWSRLPGGAHGKLIRRCLTKDRKLRLQAIGEARIALEHPEADEKPQSVAPPSGRSKSSMVSWALAAAATLTAAGLGYVAYQHRAEPPPALVQFTIGPPDKGGYANNSIPVVSPDGKHVVFRLNTEDGNRLWVRDLGSLDARPLPGTDNGIYPFWSPDSRTVGFASQNKLRRIDVTGGPPVVICDLSGAFRGGSWANTPKDVIVFGLQSTGIFQVAPGGGTPVAVTQKPEVGSHRWPFFLPDGHHFLYTASSGEKSAIYVADLASSDPGKDRRPLPLAESNAVYSNGHLLFVRQSTLLAQPFDLASLQLTGDPVALAEEIVLGNQNTQQQFSASPSAGTLVYVTGGHKAGVQLTWFDRKGTASGTVGTPARISDWVTLSPDGNTAAVAIREKNIGDIWLYNLIRGTQSRFTFGASGGNHPIWSPDGSHLAFTSEGNVQVLQKALDRGSEETLNSGLDNAETLAEDWSRDGRYIVERVIHRGPPGYDDLWILPVSSEKGPGADKGGEKKAFPYLQGGYQERSAKISPDGKWLAYASDETSRMEVYVQSFPEPGGKVQISTAGGIQPIWSRDGKELYFIGNEKMMAVPVRSGSKFEAGQPVPLFDAHTDVNNFNGTFDVGKDGRFLIPTVLGDSAATPLTVVLNWPAMLKK